MTVEKRLLGILSGVFLYTLMMGSPNAATIKIIKLYQKDGSVYTQGFSKPPCSKLQREELRMDISMDGEIELGDTKKIAQIITENEPNKQKGRSSFSAEITVFLNSPGGSAVEGIRLAQYFFDEGIQTRIKSGASCLSACAIAFMHGAYVGLHDYRQIVRILERGARLGFHAPYFQYDESKLYSGKELAERQEAMALLTSFLLSISDDEIFAKALLSRMYATGPNDIYFLSRVDEVGRFHINPNIENLAAPTLENLALACTNWYAWNRRRTSSLDEKNWYSVRWPLDGFKATPGSNGQIETSGGTFSGRPTLVRRRPDSSLVYHSEITNNLENMGTCVIEYVIKDKVLHEPRIEYKYIWTPADRGRPLGDSAEWLQLVHFIHPALLIDRIDEWTRARTEGLQRPR